MTKLDKMTIPELRKLRDEIDEAITARVAKDKDDLRERFKALAAESGLDLADVISTKARKPAKNGVVHRNPADPTQTWSGRGRRPKWMAEQAAA